MRPPFLFFFYKILQKRNGRGCKYCPVGVMLPKKEALRKMIRYRIRKDRLVSEDGVKYIAYGVDAYSWFVKVKSIKDISLNKRQLARQIKVWNRCHISLAHLEQVAASFVENEASIKEKPYSLV